MLSTPFRGESNASRPLSDALVAMDQRPDVDCLVPSVRLPPDDRKRSLASLLRGVCMLSQYMIYHLYDL